MLSLLGKPPRRAWVRTGTASRSAGKSHSCERPTRLLRAPSAQTISVAEGRSETMRGMLVVASDSTRARTAIAVFRPRSLQGDSATSVSAGSESLTFGRARRARGMPRIPSRNACAHPRADLVPRANDARVVSAERALVGEDLGFSASAARVARLARGSGLLPLRPPGERLVER